MFCSNCGAQIKAGSFCPICSAQLINGAASRQTTSQPAGLVPSVSYINGAPNPNPTVEIWSDPSLPKGLFRGGDGMIRWIVTRKKYSMYFYLNEQTVGMTGVQKREDTVGQAFKDMMLSGLELAAGSIVRSSEAYNGQELPWNSNGDIDNISLSVPRIRKIKGDPKTGEIKLREILSNLTLYTEPEYYRFVLEYIIHHAPEARMK